MRTKCENKILYQCFVVLVAFTVFFFRPLKSWIEMNQLTAILYTPQLLFLLGSIWIYFSNKLKPQDIGLIKSSVAYYHYVLALAAIIFIWMSALHGMIEPTPLRFSDLKVSMISLVGLLIIAPITEEVFFRGILFQQFLKKYPLRTSMIVSSAVFMCTHHQLWLGAFILGLITSFATYKSKSIFPGIVFHCISNTFVLYAHNVAPNLGVLRKVLFF
ncbi:MAG: CPBP family intramembrane metalloprotease [Bdellovibrionales bacterium]|nr:CPBP family intramembrane metalloprotease [Bdellovibrionales bacterium]